MTVGGNVVPDIVDRFMRGGRKHRFGELQVVATIEILVLADVS